MKNSFLAFVTISAFALVGSSPAMAASSTWTGTGTGLQEWSAAGNWNSTAGIPGGVGTTGNTDTATFNIGSAGTSVNIDAGRNVENITFDTSAGTYTIGGAGANAGNPLALTNQGVLSIAATFKSTNTTETINAPLILEPASTTLAGTYTFLNNTSSGSNVLNFAGNISSGTTTAGATLILAGTNASATNTISGAISNGGSSSFSLSLGGSSVWLLSGNNSGMTGGTISLSSGTTLLSGPTLLIGSNTALGSDTVNFNGSSQTGAPNFGAVGNITVSNNFTNNTTSGETFVGSGNLTINGTFTNSKITNTSLVNLATGTLRLDGTVYLTSGTATSALFQMQGSGNTTFGGNIFDSSSTGTGTKFLNFGSGTITISGTYNATGSFSDYGGTLVLDTSSAGARLPNNSLILGGVTLDLSRGTTSSNQTVGSGGTSFKLGQTTIQDTNSGTARINLGAIAASTGALANFGSGAASTSTANGSSGIIGAAYTFGGTDWATSNGSGTAISAYGGYTTFSAVSGASTNYQLIGGSSIGAGLTVQQGTLKINSSGAGQSLALDPTATYTTTGILYVGSDDYSITGGTLNTTQSQLILQQWGSGKLTISSSIADRFGAVVNLVKGGTGTLVLSGANNYTGVTDIDDGTVAITSDSNLGGQNSAAVVSSSTTSNVVTMAATPSDLVVGSSFLGSTVASISGSLVTLTGNANANISSSTPVGFITSATNMTLNLNGGTLEADSTFSLAETLGAQTVNRSVLLGANGGTFSVSSGNTLTVAGTIGNLTNADPGFTVSPMGALSKTGAGSLVLSAANTYTGGTTVKAGTLVATNTTGSATGTGALSVATGATLAGTGTITSTNNTINGNMLVGQISTADVNTASVLKMTASVATTFSGANLTFNLNTANTNSTKLDFGATTSVLFNGSNTLTFNLQGGTTIADGTQYVLFTDSNTASTPFGGTGYSVDGSNKITGLTLVFDVNGTQVSTYNGSSLLLSNGNIDLVIATAVPEPGTWALMLGGLAMLVVLQRSRRSKQA